MKRNLLLLLTICIISLLSSCTIADHFKYGNPTKQFMESLMKKDYDKCMSLMDLDKAGKGITKEALRTSLDGFRSKIVTDFGENIDYSYMRKGDQNTMGVTYSPDATTILMQISNNKDVGVVEAMFDKKTNKISNVKTLSIKEPIPSMKDFWIFGIVGLIIPLFNIYVIRRVIRSDMAHKWLACLVIVVLNVGAIGVSPAEGFIYRFWKLQYFLGYNFIKMGYLGSSFIIGIPIGGLVILWMLKTGRYPKDASLKAQANLIKGKRFKGKS